MILNLNAKIVAGYLLRLQNGFTYLNIWEEYLF